MRPSLVERLDRGVQLLDVAYGEHWVWIVDPDTIEMMQACGCVVGQLERDRAEDGVGSFYTGLDFMHIHGDSDRFAFDLAHDDGRQGIEWTHLEAAWRGRIAALRAVRPRP